MGSSDKECFAKSGPKHITEQIDWGKEEHRRGITACLIKGTYVLERDRTQRRQQGTPEALAPAWWESFHFRRRTDYKFEFGCRCVSCEFNHSILKGQRTRFIYGAVFEYVPPPDGGGALRRSSAPSFVVAFRGTMPWDRTFLRDMQHNLCILLNKQSWFEHARGEVGRLLAETGGNNASAIAGTSRPHVWLAGHSLGASIALDVGRHMMTNGNVNLPAFLFNPPHVSLAPAISEEAKRDVYTVGYIGKHFLGEVLTQHKDRMEELFEKLRPWQPNLYVHERDVICKGFIHYFEQREVMKARLPDMATSAATLSFRDMGHSLFGKHKERPHLLPSAVLWKNQSSGCGAHGLRQWWQDKLVLSHKLYTWP
ncbi:unnamed protein product [Urochloa decumbens]|uniref:Fungal lipase-like domain-containing protein n=1 Tax=Urochloa decumbens TaxID=240449 RepID=A0ABC9FXG5_9POAL